MRRVQTTAPKLSFKINTLILFSSALLFLLSLPGFIQADIAGYETDYEGDVLVSDSLLVNSMKTTMYEFVTDDEEIDSVSSWVSKGSLNNSEFKEVVVPIMKENCTKCHSVSSTMSDAVPEKPLVKYAEVVMYVKAGLPTKPTN